MKNWQKKRKRLGFFLLVGTWLFVVSCSAKDHRHSQVKEDSNANLPSEVADGMTILKDILDQISRSDILDLHNATDKTAAYDAIIEIDSVRLWEKLDYSQRLKAVRFEKQRILQFVDQIKQQNQGTPLNIEELRSVQKEVRLLSIFIGSCVERGIRSRERSMAKVNYMDVLSKTKMSLALMVVSLL